MGQKLMTSRKNIYSEFNLPTSMLADDQLIIPITIHNLLRDEKSVRFSILETIISREKILKQDNLQFTVGGKNQKQFPYDFNTNGKDLREGDEVQISATIALYEDEKEGQIYDFVTKSTKIMIGGFNQTKSKSGMFGMPDEGESGTANKVSWNIVYPEDFVGNPKLMVKIKTRPLETILDAIEALIKNPHGCFE